MSYYLAVTPGPCDEAMAALKLEEQGALLARVAPSAFLYHFAGEAGVYIPGLDVLKRFEIIIAEVAHEIEVCSLRPEYMDEFRSFKHQRDVANTAADQVPM